MAKSIITIETEDLLIDGIPHVKRVIKENDVILNESVVTTKSLTGATKLNIFMRWITYLKTGEPSPYAGCKIFCK